MASPVDYPIALIYKLGMSATCSTKFELFIYLVDANIQEFGDMVFSHMLSKYASIKNKLPIQAKEPFR